MKYNYWDGSDEVSPACVGIWMKLTVEGIKGEGFLQ